MISASRYLTAACGTALALLVLTACASERHPTSAVAPRPSPITSVSPVEPATQVRTFVPYLADGRSAVRVTRTGKGTCWTTSVAAPVRGAYRCFAANQILDPCFVAPHSTDTVLCVPSPWSSAQRITLTAALPKHSVLLNSSRPWALQLANGARCLAVTGTAPAVAGVSLPYSCGNGFGAALTASRGKPVSARYARTDGTTLRTVRIAALWRA